jgi:hypothetical protein
MRSYLHTDGEANIMNEAFDPDVLHEFADALIDYMKGGPSATSLLQEFDIDHFFDSLKACCVSIAKRCTDVANDTLQKNLEERLFIPFRLAFPEAVISTDFKAKIIHGLLVTAYATKKHWNSNKMMRSCLTTGLHRNGVEPGGDTINFNRLMTRTLCSTLTAEELKLMKDCSDVVAAKMQQDGKILLLVHQFFLYFTSIDNYISS